MLSYSALTASQLDSMKPTKLEQARERATHIDTLAIIPGVAVVTGNPELASPAADMALMRDLYMSRGGAAAHAGNTHPVDSLRDAKRLCICRPHLCECSNPLQNM